MDATNSTDVTSDSPVVTGDSGPDTGETDAVPDGSEVSETGTDSSNEDVTEPVDSGTDASTADVANDVVAPIEAGVDSSLDATLPADSGTDSMTSVETGPDSAPEAGHEAGPPPLGPCTASNSTDCVQCSGNTDNMCTPTEALFVGFDVANKVITAPGPDSDPSSCYGCLLGAGCLDDDTFTDTGHECEDPIGQTGTTAECIDTITCILSTKCAVTGVSTCYCGTAGLSTSCQGNPAPGPINGACDHQFATGNGYPLTDGTDNVKALNNTARAAGRAGQIFQCAAANQCTACQ